MDRRPQDFFGFEDYTGGDPQDDIDRITRAQERWDLEYEALPWYKKLIVWFEQ
jgi:hypothetical protein